MGNSADTEENDLTYIIHYDLFAKSLTKRLHILKFSRKTCLQKKSKLLKQTRLTEGYDEKHRVFQKTSVLKLNKMQI